MGKYSLATGISVLLLFSSCTIIVDEGNFFWPHYKAIPSYDAGQVLQIIPVSISNTPENMLSGYIFKTNDEAPYIIYFTGVGEAVADDFDRLCVLAKTQKVNVISYDKRGYGDSKGRPALDWMMSDSLLIYDRVKKEFKPKSLFVYGHSLGTVSAEYIGANREPAGIILEAPFPNAAEALPSISNGFVFPFNPMIRFEASAAFAGKNPQPEELIKDVYAPLLIVCGTKDTSFPASFSERMYEKAGSRKKKIVIIEGQDHFLKLDSEQLAGEYGEFLKENMVK